MKIVLKSSDTQIRDLLEVRQDLEIIEEIDNADLIICHSSDLHLTQYKCDTILLKDDQKNDVPGILHERLWGIVDLSWNHDWISQALLSAISLKSRYIRMEESLSRLMDEIENSLDQVKQIHDKIVPLRFERHSPLKIFSKFLSGKSGGSVYFDFIDCQNSTLVYIVEARSHIASAVSMNVLEQFQVTGALAQINLSLIHQVSQALYKSLLEIDPQIADGVNLMICSISHKDLKLEGIHCGKITVVQPFHSSFLIDGNHVQFNTILDKPLPTFSYQLSRDERLLFLTSNFQGRMNWNTLEGVSEPKELINEMFTWFTRKKGDLFLEKDTATILLEVDNNALLSI